MPYGRPRNQPKPTVKGKPVMTEEEIRDKFCELVESYYSKNFALPIKIMETGEIKDGTDETSITVKNKDGFKVLTIESLYKQIEEVERERLDNYPRPWVTTIIDTGVRWYTTKWDGDDRRIYAILDKNERLPFNAFETEKEAWEYHTNLWAEAQAEIDIANKEVNSSLKKKKDYLKVLYDQFEPLFKDDIKRLGVDGTKFAMALNRNDRFTSIDSMYPIAKYDYARFRNMCIGWAYSELDV